VSARRLQPRALGLPLALLALAAGTLLALVGAEQGLLHLIPVLLVAVPLLLGRFPGERALARSATERNGHREAQRGDFSLLRAAVLPARGGRLIAYGLARRGPPASSADHCHAIS
jgi:hypothetical protein